MSAAPQQQALRVQLRVCEGAALRALGLIERRGFRLDAIALREAQGDGQALEVVVSSDRPAALLQRQLERLHDVSWVELLAVGEEGAALPRKATMRPVSGAR